MNAGLHSLVPNWFRREEHDMADNEIPPPPPPIAVMPMPEPTEEEKRLKVIADAHVFVAQLAQERQAKDGVINRLQAEVGDLANKLQQERRKSGLLELDLAERDNTIATLQSDIIERGRLLGLLKDINEKASAAFARLSIEGAKKESRTKNAKQKPKGKSDNGQSTDQSAKANG